MKLKFKNITDEVYQKIIDGLAEFGVLIEGDKGKLSQDGMEGKYKRNPKKETLKIEVSKTPFMVPKSFVIGKIKEAVESVGGEVD